MGVQIALLALVTVIWLVHQNEQPKGFWLTILFIGSGYAAGWAVGFLASPLSDETSKFEKYAKLLASGISIYLLARLEPTFHLIFEGGALIKTPIYGIRFLAFTIAVILGAIGIYVFRTYLALKQNSSNKKQ